MDTELLRNITLIGIIIYGEAWVYFIKVLLSYFPVTKIEND